MALALYLLPLLLRVAASRVHHKVQEVEDKLVGVDLADILIPILSKQELESKANNQSDERVHDLKKLIERSHVAIILAKPHDKEENHSIDSKHGRIEVVGKHMSLEHVNYGENRKYKHDVHQKFNGIENNKHSKHVNTDEVKQVNQSSPNDKTFEYASSREDEKNLSYLIQKSFLKIVNSEETSKDEDSNMFPAGKKEKINNMLKSSLYYNQENSNEDNYSHDLRKDINADHEEEVEQHLQDMLTLKKEILNNSGLNSKTANLQEDSSNAKIEPKDKNKYSLRNHVPGIKEHKEKHTEGINNSKDNKSSDERSESNEDSVDENNLLKSGLYSKNKDSYEKINEKEEYKEDYKVIFKKIRDQKSRDGISESDEYNVRENDSLTSGLNSKNKDFREDNSYKKFERNDENEHSLNNDISQKVENKDIISIEYLKDGSSESDEEDNKYLQKSSLQTKYKESQENDYEEELKQKYQNKNSINVLQTLKHDSYILKDLKDLLDSRDESSECDDEDGDNNRDALMKMIDLAKMHKDMHFYDRRDNEDKHKRGVLNLFFHFA